MSTQYWAGKTVVVTGATGFIGTHFVTELLSRGAHVVCPVRGDAPRLPAATPDETRLRTVPADLLDENALRGTFETTPGGVDAVIHCAAVWGNAGFRYDHPARVFEENLRITTHILHCARRYGVPDTVLMGSGEVYRTEVDRPFRETDFDGSFTYTPDGYYLAKVYEETLAETYRLEYGMRIFQPRPSSVYGPGDDFGPHTNKVIPIMFRKAMADEGITLWGDGLQTRTYIFVTDLVRGVLETVEKNDHHIVNMGTPEVVTMRRLASMVYAALGRPEDIRLDRNKPAGRRSRTLDLSRLHETISFAPRDLDQGLRQTAAWLRRTPPPAG
ncbi:NAD-dependent epimerase/dehydratase family protein [Streptomyces sp. NRRL F-5727]|uniref:NAD-dependent epimerase/dehydratase family protein n=1 Tax=Streptomyces sp. NRRL F-5727 TaxID=1463871 RepID=UPI0004C8CEDE|nr:NAD-dependent epimerase/dehydratase family protein [Streptomyces sp. NRRL F-5727]